MLRAGEPMPLRVRAYLARLSHPGLSCPKEQGRHSVRVFRTRARSRRSRSHSCPVIAEPELDLNGVLHALIERARYDLVIDYGQPPDPPLGQRIKSWAAAIVARAANARREETSKKENHSMNCQDHFYRNADPRLVNRRWFLEQCGVGLGAIALGDLLKGDGYAAGPEKKPWADDSAGSQGPSSRAQGQAGACSCSWPGRRAISRCSTTSRNWPGSTARFRRPS